MKRLMGGETEYGLSAHDAEGKAIDQSHLLKQFIDFARATLPYSSESTNGRFLSNGGLLYLDHGLHVEWATPECTSPHDVVRYLRAGDATMAELIALWPQKAKDIRSVFGTRCNVDYHARTLWASHESHLHYCDPRRLPDQLVPFLVSRLIFTGAGGWDCLSPGLSFTLSPRAHVITEVSHCDTQHVRPIFHVKNETLSRTGSHRLHVSTSETLCSDVATLLRFGTTALVVAVLDAGALPRGDLALASPVAALKTFARDPRCQLRAALADGRELTAVEIQRQYLAEVERHLDSGRLPSWSDDICALWRSTLDDLAAGGAGARTSLDWKIKHNVYARWLERRGIAWQKLEAWNAVITRLYRNWRIQGQDPFLFDLERVFTDSTMVHAIRRCRWTAERKGLHWEELLALATARKELFEIDTRFGGIGASGIFESLDASNVLTHRVPGLDTTTNPGTAPTDTRAHVRGAVVRRLSEAKTRYGAEWTGIYDYDHQRELDLGDPFELEERWHDRPSRRGSPPASPSR